MGLSEGTSENLGAFASSDAEDCYVRICVGLMVPKLSKQIPKQNLTKHKVLHWCRIAEQPVARL